ncbi:MAG: glycine zipper 2TM domain-containing protein [Novosphingobium sp.]
MQTFKTTALALLAPVMVLTASPALADDRYDQYRGGDYYGRDYRDDYRRDDYRQDYRNRGYYGEPGYANTRTWRGDDGRYYCRRSDGTTGLIIGGAAGAIICREVGGRRGERRLGAIVGGAGGALLGRAVDRSVSNNGYRCR